MFKGISRRKIFNSIGLFYIHKVLTDPIKTQMKGNMFFTPIIYLHLPQS